MTINWSLFVNFFLNATEGNFQKALDISRFHFNALTANAPTNTYIAARLTYFTTFADAMEAAETARLAQEGSQHGSVVGFTALLKQMTDNVNGFDAAIQVVYAKTTSRYAELFPQGHTPFLTGSQASRVQALATLLSTIGSDGALATIKATIQTYSDALNAALDTKSQSKTNTSDLSTAEETARVNMCNAMLVNYGLLISHYPTTLDLAKIYFDEQTLRPHQQTLFTHIVKMGGKQLVVHRKLVAEQNIRFTNNGTVALIFYYTMVKDGVMVGVSITVAPSVSVQHTVDEFAAGDATYLYAENQNTLVDGHYEVELL